MTNYEKIDYCAAMVCYLRGENFIPKIKKNIKVKDLCHTRENIETLFI